MIKCPNCTGELKYDTNLEKVKCDYCGSTYTADELRKLIHDKVKMSEEENVVNDPIIDTKESSKGTYEGKAYRCSQCGATLLTFDETAITFCNYCGSQAMLEDKMMKLNNPDFIIPFKKSKEECVTAYKKKVSEFLFAPKYMKSDMVVEKFRGIYMPYGIYYLYQHGTTKNSGSRYDCRRGDYKYYADYTITTDLDASYEGMSFDLVSKFYDNYSTAIPFNYQDAKDFNPAYMAGFYADSLDVSADVYDNEAIQVANTDAGKRLRKIREFSKYGCYNPTVKLNADKKVGMFPIYFLAMRDKKKKDCVNYAVVNGQTGSVAADLPIDFGKYIFGSLILALIIFLIINTSFVLTPTKVCVFSIIMGIISLWISKKQLKQIEIKEKHLDDKGVKYASSKKKEKVKNEDEVNSHKSFFVENKALFITLILLILCDIFEWYSLANGSPLKNYTLIDLALIIIFEMSWVLIPYILLTLFVRYLNKPKIVDSTKKARKNPKNRGRRLEYTFKEILAIICPIIPIITDAVNDSHFYIAAIVSLILVILSFYDLVKEHNLLVSNKLPQLEKRGGDENEA